MICCVLEHPENVRLTPEKPSMQLKDHVFLVTGGASGLGAAVARLGRAGRRVGRHRRSQSRCRRSSPAELGHSARFAAATDVTSEADATAAIDLALASFGHLHALVNCAGIAPSEKILGRDPPHRLETFARAVNINLVGTFNMIRLAAAAISKEDSR
jgi:NAD(P)-dependent dehydrogenase (short-subunit alcohol dehydrogenase family)